HAFPGRAWERGRSRTRTQGSSLGTHCLAGSCLPRKAANLPGGRSLHAMRSQAEPGNEGDLELVPTVLAGQALPCRLLPAAKAPPISREAGASMPCITRQSLGTREI